MLSVFNIFIYMYKNIKQKQMYKNNLYKNLYSNYSENGTRITMSFICKYLK